MKFLRVGDRLININNVSEIRLLPNGSIYLDDAIHLEGAAAEAAREFLFREANADAGLPGVVRKASGAREPAAEEEVS